MTMERLVNEVMNSGYAFIGIRHMADDENYQKGDCCRNSYDWDYVVDCSTYDTESPVELPGTCAYDTRIDLGWDEPEEIQEKLEKALRESSVYFGEAIVIGGDRMEYGNDEEEIIINGAMVIEVLEDSAAIAA
ncbi:hypothetical protein GKG47_06020 [Lactonifactor sp. BIOML-A3]|uniref:hypothetical protein n=1 Tax=unclassified Lactonifactor TaxID=2636670 RepID=UPI0012AF18CF|nr:MULTISPECIES: hypothetical protein [unclassified Lactonifactor]MSA01014.1 hypothetical protein [Lactonifactor sp. BIOML-A5]MSA07808.1 hypothetical protein [Lactonifactor sp. BIOML-A4]MSA12004.1 hypothetical protein [Lactonifactor sp. BIOML-A3]MSA16444.1 hypothetical protein [Lactonifactor sp. BIOML-A2]MSA37048.1 hypothetical protein [Lactonifactor sp. BIOML-A1]